MGFISGIAFCVILQRSWLDDILEFIVTVLTGVVAYLGLVGCVVLLLFTALFFWWVTRTWTENARAKFDMDRTWNQRRNYRLPPDQRG